MFAPVVDRDRPGSFRLRAHVGRGEAKVDLIARESRCSSKGSTVCRRTGRHGIAPRRQKFSHSREPGWIQFPRQAEQFFSGLLRTGAPRGGAPWPWRQTNRASRRFWSEALPRIRGWPTAMMHSPTSRPQHPRPAQWSGTGQAGRKQGLPSEGRAPVLKVCHHGGRKLHKRGHCWSDPSGGRRLHSESSARVEPFSVGGF